MSSEESLMTEPQSLTPRPISDRVCICGCGHSFTPSRSDKVYYNNQHANYGYNHGKRKAKKKSRTKEEAILAKNDEVLHKHYTSEKDSKIVVRYYDVLKADGYMFAYNIGRTESKDEISWYSYRYYYSIDNIEPKQVKIYKR